VLGFVKSAEGFNVTAAAINGFSDLIITLWGDAGRHHRSAIGAGALPFGMPVEVEAIVTLACPNPRRRCRSDGRAASLGSLIA
jgi:enamine deaminase RidA (YjgF/YER057c/UK114 family)